jgi:hypothetical protein
MADLEELDVSARTNKPSYTRRETVEITVSAKTMNGEPVYAEVRWSLRVPDGDVRDYSEFSQHTHTDTGAVTWHWPTDDDFGLPESGDYELFVDALARDDTGDITGEGSASLTFAISPTE